ncbi:MAG: glycosyl transferase family 2 [Nitrospirae bacterium RBG_16_43_11]|nr:MAG: glycosyl transferase family 2 [Nitrospirae bacterium RBG_16_43_11]
MNYCGKEDFDTIIVIPAFNEEANIASLIDNIRTSAPEVDILVVDDGSADRTSRIAAKAGAVVVRLPFNLGYGAALQTGFKYALMKRYRYVIQMDADGQHDPDSIGLLLKEIGKGDIDVVIGSRFLSSVVQYKIPLLRKAGISLFSRIVSFIIHQKITDPTSGFQALNRDAVRFHASPYYPTDYPDADTIIMLHRAGLRIRESPVRMYPSVSGKTMHSGLKPVYYMFKMFLSMFVTLLRKSKFEKRITKEEDVSNAASTKDICNKY